MVLQSVVTVADCNLGTGSSLVAENCGLYKTSHHTKR